MATYFIAREPFTLEANGTSYAKGDTIRDAALVSAISQDDHALSHVIRLDDPATVNVAPSIAPITIVDLKS